MSFKVNKLYIISAVILLAVTAISEFWFKIELNKVLPARGKPTKKNIFFRKGLKGVSSVVVYEQETSKRLH